MSLEKFRPDPDISIEIPTEKFRPSSGNIFIDQAERANKSTESLVQRFLSLTQQIGKLKERMRAPNYVLNKGDVAQLSQLGAEKDETANEIKRRESLTRPTIDSNLTGRDNWVNKHRKP